MATIEEIEKIPPEQHREQLVEAFENSQETYADNTAYYESERRPSAIGVATPPEMRDLLAQVGYPRLYVNALAERLDVEGFRLPNTDEADEELWSWWQANDLDVESSLGHTEAFVHGRSYVTVAAPDENDPGIDPSIPIIRVESPMALYADIDARTRRVMRAIRVGYDDEGSEIVRSTVYLPNETHYLINDAGTWKPEYSPVSHGMGMVPVIPLTNRSRLADLYGTSEITPELRSVTDAASRVMMNMQATAELMAVPQRLLFGVAQEALQANPEDPGSVLEAYLARIIAIEDSDAHATQFAAAELRNFVEALQELAKQAAAYTGLPPQYLAFSSENPASAEAIRAAESRLVKNAERKCKVFGGAWEHVMRVSKRVMGTELKPDDYRMETLWRDPSTPTYAAKADAATKLYNGGAGVIPKERARIDMGYSVEERRQMRDWDDQENPLGSMAAMYGSRPTAVPNPEPAQSETEPPQAGGEVA